MQNRRKILWHLNLLHFFNFVALKGWQETPDSYNCDSMGGGSLYISTEEDCKTMAGYIGRPWKGSVGTNSSLPIGCISIYNPTSIHSRPVYFNNAKEGRKQNDIGCICLFDPFFRNSISIWIYRKFQKIYSKESTEEGG